MLHLNRKFELSIFLSFCITSSFVVIGSCQSNKTNEQNKNNTKKELPVNTEANLQNNSKETRDDRLNNAGSAKSPKGTLSYIINGKKITINENQVQCMYIGMNSTMAQSVISGGNQVSITHMQVPRIGEVSITKIGVLPSVGIRVLYEGIEYTNMFKGSVLKMEITKVVPDGKNYYVAGKFSGTFYNAEGTKSITVTDGVFASAYL